jgi:pimeloyl-ACP methyl ester carboxylesterase
MRLASLARATFSAAVFLLLMSTGSIAQSNSLYIRQGKIVESNSRYIKQTSGSRSVIVFVHGIFGDSTSTWTNQNGAYWPLLLAGDPFFSNYDVYAYEYPSRFFGGNFSIDEIADNMRLLFEVDGVSDYGEIIFVSHSMGGLVTRAYLNKNRNAVRVRLAYFYSTPTTGSELASVGTLISANPQLAKMRSMQSSDYLADLQRQWLNINYDIPSFCAYETLKTYGVNVVTQASASNLCNRRLDPIDGDHLTIVKPTSIRDTAYLALKAAIQAIQRTAAKSESDLQTGVIRPVSEFLTHDEAVKWAVGRAVEVQGYQGSDNVKVHTLFIKVAFRFLDSRFNNAAYFAAFDSIKADWKGEFGRSRGRVSAQLLPIVLDSKSGTFMRIAKLDFSGKPIAGDRLILSLGPITSDHVLSDESFRWEATGSLPYQKGDKVFPWKIAFAEVRYESKRPDWLTITDAQMLNGRDGVALIRIVISNPTDDTRPLLSMSLSLRHPRFSADACVGPDTTQIVVFKWEKSEVSEQLTAETTLHGVEVPVEIISRLEGSCSDYSISANVPLSASVPANTTEVVSLRLKEMPSLPMKKTMRKTRKTSSFLQTFDLDTIPLSNFVNWPSKSISIHSDQSSIVKPDSFYLISPTETLKNEPR